MENEDGMLIMPMGLLDLMGWGRGKEATCNGASYLRVLQ